MQHRRRTLFLVQLSVSIALVSYLLSRIEFGQLTDALQNLHVGLLCVAVVQFTLQPVLGALRWMLVARALGDALPFGMALRYTWIGTFFAQVLPGSVGGDAVRMWLYWRRGLGRRLAFNTVTLERAAMMVSLLILVALVQPGLARREVHDFALWLPYILLAAAFCGFAVLMLADRFVARSSNWVALRAVAYISADARTVFLAPLAACGLLVASIAAYANMASTVWLIALALQLPVSFGDCFLFTPIVVLASILPISIGGWGVREGLMILLFSHVGVPAADALILSVVFGASGILISLPGAALWVRGGYRRSDLEQADSVLAAETPPGR